jgi:hypothetical protein
LNRLDMSCVLLSSVSYNQTTSVLSQNDPVKDDPTHFFLK